MSAQKKSETRPTQLLTVRMGNETYGIEILKIARVLNCEGIFKTGGEPEFLEGLIELDGDIVPVLDLKERLEIQDGDPGRRRIVILDLKQRLLGIIVDDFLEVLPASQSKYEQLPAEIVDDGRASCIAGVTEGERGVIMVISPKQILTPHELEALVRFENQTEQVAPS